MLPKNLLSFLILSIFLAGLSAHAETRLPAVAGTFYPGDPDQLQAMVNGHLAAVGEPAVIDGDIIAMIVPHAGLVYSGAIAAHAYATLKDSPVDKVILCGPPTLVPRHFADMGVEMSYNLMKAIADADVIYSLRMQFERQQANFLPSIAEYIKLFGLTTERLKHARKDCIVMHPGPINRGIEMTSEVADSPRSVILDQVTNGVAVRMAVMFLLARAAG